MSPYNITVANINRNDKVLGVPTKRPPFWAFLLVSLFWCSLAYGRLFLLSLGFGGVPDSSGLALFIAVMTLTALLSATFGFLVSIYRKLIFLPFLIAVLWLLYVFTSVYFSFEPPSVLQFFSLVFPSTFISLAFTFVWMANKGYSAKLRGFFLSSLRHGLIIGIVVSLLLNPLVYGLLYRAAFELALSGRIVEFKKSPAYLKLNYLPEGAYKLKDHYLPGDKVGVQESFACDGYVKNADYTNYALFWVSQSQLINENTDLLSKLEREKNIGKGSEYVLINGSRGLLLEYDTSVVGDVFGRLAFNTGSTSVEISVKENCKISKEDLIKMAESMQPL